MSDVTWAGAMPETYDRDLGPAVFRPFGEHLAARAAQIAPRRVLELAAGTGLVTAELVRTLPDADIVATDLNPPMVEWGAARVPGAGWQVCDAMQTGLSDASFDLVVCAFGVMFFPDRPAAYEEMRRVLLPGGHVLVSVWDELALSSFATAVVEAAHEVLPEDPPTFLCRTPHGYADPTRIRADAEAGGLVVESVDHVVLEGRTPSAADVTRGYCLGSPMRFELEQRGDAVAISEQIAAVTARILGPGPLIGSNGAWVLTARVPSADPLS